MLLPIDPVERILRSRRSIRKYTAETVPAEWIESIIACAALAPSPSNSQPVRFFRISSPAVLEDLHECMIARRAAFLEQLNEGGGSRKTRNLINAYFRYSEFMFKAPVVICLGVVEGAGSFSARLCETNVIDRDLRRDTDLDISVGLALSGLLLKSAALGLGACTLTAPLVFLPDLEKRLGVKGVQIKCFVAIGFPDETPPHIEKPAMSEIYSEI
ncbi:MAG: nitroreductase family protein [Syntrophobacteraceae bacterium]